MIRRAALSFTASASVLAATGGAHANPYVAGHLGFGFGHYDYIIDDNGRRATTDGFMFASTAQVAVRVTDLILLGVVVNFDPIFKATANTATRPPAARETVLDVTGGLGVVWTPKHPDVRAYATTAIVFGGDVAPNRMTGLTGTGPLLHLALRLETLGTTIGPELRVMLGPRIDGVWLDNYFASLSLGLGGHLEW